MSLSFSMRLRAWAGRLKRDSVALYFAARDPQAPFLARALAVLVAAYALSPIDLVPDFIPVLGYIDDLLLVPLGLWLVLRLMPEAVMLRARARAETVLARPRSWLAAAVVVIVWLASALLLARVLGWV
jgi:uncharacterized membrane protein YkvA (DUF1232 family)